MRKRETRLDYVQVLVQTYENRGEPAAERIRARPVGGQGFSVKLKLECSVNMREGHPVGTRFIVDAKLTNRQGGGHFLYTHYSWPYKVVTSREAAHFLKRLRGK